MQIIGSQVNTALETQFDGALEECNLAHRRYRTETTSTRAEDSIAESNLTMFYVPTREYSTKQQLLLVLNDGSRRENDASFNFFFRDNRNS